MLLSINIVSFVQHFNIPKETFIELTRGGIEILPEDEGRWVYSLEQIDAIYSGDQRLINETFCGPLAFVNEEDGELYSIYWLADHSAEEYAEAGLPMDRVAEVLTLAQEEYASTSVAELAESAEATLTEALALEEAAASAK